MGRFIKGDVVVLPFPFSDLTSSKRRPALVISQLAGDEDIILCMISKQQHDDTHSVPLLLSDFANGGLDTDSFIRPKRLFTADSNLIIQKRGTISQNKLSEVTAKLIYIIKN